MVKGGHVSVLTSGAKAALLVSWLALAIGGFFVVKQNIDLRHERADRLTDACNREQSDRVALRRLIVFFEGRSLANPQITPAERPGVLAFYNHALQIVPPVHC